MESKAANEHVLTLKNIYRMLTKFDYMNHSYPPLSPMAMKGQTLVRFWRELFTLGLPEGIDLSLFDSESGRSRSLTKVLNRTGTERLADKWFMSLSASSGEELLLSMTRAWQDTLTGHDYNSGALNVRLNSFLEALSASGELGREENENLFLNLRISLDESAGAPTLFRHALALSLLSVFALYGNRLKDTMLDRIRMTADRGMNDLYRRSLHSDAEAQVISRRDCLLCVQPLAQDRYFGNDAALESSMDVFVGGGGKLLICGLGGIGKTEFARQLLQRLRASGLYRRIAFVQYETDLNTSFALAFDALDGLSVSQRIEKTRDILEKNDGGRTLLLIDNLDNSPADDSDIAKLSTFG